MRLLPSGLRQALRSLRRAPAFTLAAVTTLALGIGANTAIFSAVNGVLLHPLAYPDPDRLVVVWGRHTTIGRETASQPDFLDWREQARSFEALAAMTSTRFNVTGAGEPEVVNGGIATANLLHVFGVVPSVGRGFRDDEERGAAPKVAMLGEGYWRRRFGAERDIVGSRILLSGVPHTVVGIVPAQLQLERPVDVWTPLATDSTRPRRADFLTVFGRLGQGVSLDRAQQEMTTIMRRLEAQYPESNASWGAEVVALREQMIGEIRPALLVFMGAVGLVLLVACANVANLMLARAAGRRREVTIRSALGASRTRLAGELLLESMLLALLGGALGLLLALWGVEGLRSLGPDTLPRVNEIGLDLRVLGFALALSLVTGLLFGLAPIWRMAGRDLHEGLAGGSRGVAGGSGIQRARSALVLGEVALAFVLLAGASLLLRSFERLQRVDPGFAADRVLTARVTLPRLAYPEEQRWLVVRAGAARAHRGRAGRALRGAGLRRAAGRLASLLELRDPGWRDAGARRGAGRGGVHRQRLVLRDAAHSPGPRPALRRELTGSAARTWRWSAGRRRSATGRARTRWAPASRFGDPADPEVRWMTVVGVVGDVLHERLNGQGVSADLRPLRAVPRAVHGAGGADLRRSAGAGAGRPARHRGDRPRSPAGRREHAGGPQGGVARPAAGERHGARRLRAGGAGARGGRHLRRGGLRRGAADPRAGDPHGARARAARPCCAW